MVTNLVSFSELLSSIVCLLGPSVVTHIHTIITTITITTSTGIIIIVSGIIIFFFCTVNILIIIIELLPVVLISKPILNAWPLPLTPSVLLHRLHQQKNSQYECLRSNFRYRHHHQHQAYNHRGRCW